MQQGTQSSAFAVHNQPANESQYTDGFAPFEYSDQWVEPNPEYNSQCDFNSGLENFYHPWGIPYILSYEGEAKIDQLRNVSNLQDSMSSTSNEYSPDNHVIPYETSITQMLLDSELDITEEHLWTALEDTRQSTRDEDPPFSKPFLLFNEMEEVIMPELTVPDTGMVNMDITDALEEYYLAPKVIPYTTKFSEYVDLWAMEDDDEDGPPPLTDSELEIARRISGCQ